VTNLIIVLAAILPPAFNSLSQARSCRVFRGIEDVSPELAAARNFDPDHQTGSQRRNDVASAPFRSERPEPKHGAAARRGGLPSAARIVNHPCDSSVSSRAYSLAFSTK
jgi:hypothetical protein